MSAPKAKKPKPKIEIMQKPIAEVMQLLDADNPREHNSDLESLALRLLFNDWQKLPTLNTNLNRLVGGHGRVMACNDLIQQSKQWFLDRWYEWYQENSGHYTKTELEKHQERFSSTYWLQIPLLAVSLSPSQHRTMLIALNRSDAVDSSEAIAKLLLAMRESELQFTTAGWDKSSRESLLSKFKDIDSESVMPTIDTKALATAINARLPDISTPQPLNSVESNNMDSLHSDKDLLHNDDIDSLHTSDDSIHGDKNTPSFEDEPEVGEGGANFNADPEPDQKKQTLFPLCIVLGSRQRAKYQSLKDSLGVRSDLRMLMKHPAFTLE